MIPPLAQVSSKPQHLDRNRHFTSYGEVAKAAMAIGIDTAGKAVTADTARAGLVATIIDGEK